MKLSLQLSERQREIATGLFILVSCVLSLGVGEGAMRIIQMVRFGTAENQLEASGLFYRDQQTGLRLARPNSKHGNIIINSRGFRSPELAVPKAANTLRLAFLGSSITYDAFVRDNETTWPHLVWQQLQEQHPGCSMDYLNAGLPGFATEHVGIHFEEFVSPTDPDVVVVVIRDINSYLDDLAIAKQHHQGVHHEFSLLGRYSLLWAKIEKNIEVIRRQRAAFSTRGKLQFESTELSAPFQVELTGLLETLAEDSELVMISDIASKIRPEQSRQKQIKAANTALYYMPYMSIQGLLQAEAEFNRVIHAVAQETGVAYAQGYQGIPGNDKYFADSVHFRTPGSRLMAQNIAKALLANPDFTALLERIDPGCRTRGADS